VWLTIGREWAGWSGGVPPGQRAVLAIHHDNRRRLRVIRASAEKKSFPGSLGWGGAFPLRTGPWRRSEVVSAVE
jgi:hypothetical protein